MSERFHRPVPFGVAVATAVCIGIVVALASVHTDSGAEAQSSTPGSSAQDSAAHVGLLRQKFEATDALPPAIAHVVSAAGASAQDARRVDVDGSGGGHPLWVVPGTDVLCEYDQGGGTCDDAARATSEGLFSFAALQTGSFLVNGVVPDGVARVTVADETGETVTAMVKDNAFSQSVDFQPLSVSFTDSYGHDRGAQFK